MIKRALKVRGKLDQFIKENNLKSHRSRIIKSSKASMIRDEKEALLEHDVLTSEDWHILVQVFEILKPFKILTKRFVTRCGPQIEGRVR